MIFKHKLPISQKKTEPVNTDNSSEHISNRIKRRDFLKTGAMLSTAAATGIYAPAIIASDRTLKVSTYGGYFENAFIDHIFPAFRAATGIKIESVTQPTAEGWLLTMAQASKAGTMLTDLSMNDEGSMMRGANIEGLFQPFDLTKIPNKHHLDDIYFYPNKTNKTIGIGALAWYTAMVINTELVKQIPKSWAEFWDPRFKDSLGIISMYRGAVLDIAAATFFDGIDTLASKEGILATINKASELKPNVKLWWRTWETMETALQNEEVVGGTYYPDATNLMAADGFPLIHLFPEEGNPIGFGSWCLSALSEKVEEAHEFVNFTCDPATQALITRKVTTAPLVARSKTDLTDEEFYAVSSDKPPIMMAHESYLKYSDFIQEEWNKMLTSD